jgi:hypothetical protein
MKQKLGTAVDQKLIRRAKAYAAERGIPLNTVIEDALRALLAQAAPPSGRSRIVETAGNLSLPADRLATLLAEDPYDAA